MLQPLLPVLQQALGRSVELADFPHISADHLNVLKTQMGKYDRDLKREADRAAGKDP
ncbi:unnamed protein product [Cuscuta europaea]|uniref:Uncharacterized protein n=1 Tax=Cuscuta europaea TaxID=41803 RepID=A0A9P0YLB5_CUSEU|nr:unnamed protein product [Cuscuta europaea]